MDNDANEVYELFEKLAFTCLQTIDIHAEELLGTEDFLLLSPKMVQFVIKRDTLCLSSESLIIAALNSWCVHRCSRRGAVATLKNKVTHKYIIQTKKQLLIPEQDPPGPEAPRALVDTDPLGAGDCPDSVWSSNLQGRLSHSSQIWTRNDSLGEGVPGLDDVTGAHQLQLPAPRQTRGSPGQNEAQAVRPAACEFNSLNH